MKTKIVAICQSCGAVADRQSDQILNGRDDMYSCPNCKEKYMEVSWDSLPIQLEEIEVSIKADTDLDGDT